MRKRNLIQKITRTIFGSPYERRIHGSAHFWGFLTGVLYLFLPVAVILFIVGAFIAGNIRLLHIHLIASSGVLWPLVYASYIVYGACAVLWIKKRRG